MSETANAPRPAIAPLARLAPTPLLERYASTVERTDDIVFSYELTVANGSVSDEELNSVRERLTLTLHDLLNETPNVQW